MKKLAGVVLGAICLNLMLMAPALAGSELPPPAGDVVVPPDATDPTAFTGANVAVWMVLAVALLAVGVTLYVTGRRRATAK